MKKFKRIQRVGALVKIFLERPNYIFSYNYFSKLFNAAKSSISEDISIVKEIFEDMSYGRIETISGSQGGVMYVPQVSQIDVKEMLDEICIEFTEKNRLIQGGFIYMTDIFLDSYIVNNISKIIASKFSDKKIDVIVTVETKGVPIAVMTGQKLNLPVAVIRRNNNKVTEGATVSINYVSGSSSNIQTMSLSRRSLKENSKVLLIDDFMKGGGTAKGMHDMMEEFDAEVVGTIIVVETKEPEKKLIDEYTSLLVLEKIDENKQILEIIPNPKLLI